MPLAISSQTVNIRYHTGLHEQKKRVTSGQVFVLRPPAVSRSENRIDQWQAIKVLNNIQAFPI